MAEVGWMTQFWRDAARTISAGGESVDGLDEGLAKKIVDGDVPDILRTA
jgi:hypothetical protein